jgi:hypothetical protein
MTASAYLWPIVDQIGYVHAAEAGSKVPAFGRGIRLDRIQVRRSQYSVAAGRRIVTVNGTEARNNIISNGDIMENASRRNAVAPGGIAVVQIIVIGVRRASVFGLRQLVINRIGVTLRFSRLLIDQGLDTGKLRSRKGSTARAIKQGVCVVCVIARDSTLGGVRHAEQNQMLPEPVRGKQGNVWQITLAIVRNTYDPRLPRRLGVYEAGSAAAAGDVKKVRAGGAVTECHAAFVPVKAEQYAAAAGIIPWTTPFEF